MAIVPFYLLLPICLPTRPTQAFHACCSSDESDGGKINDPSASSRRLKGFDREILQFSFYFWRKMYHQRHHFMGANISPPLQWGDHKNRTPPPNVGKTGGVFAVVEYSEKWHLFLFPVGVSEALPASVFPPLLSFCYKQKKNEIKKPCFHFSSLVFVPSKVNNREKRCGRIILR